MAKYVVVDMFAKAGVDLWEDMPAETVAKCIEYVKGRLPSSAALWPDSAADAAREIGESEG